MDLNADFGARAVVHASRIPWTPSPIAGVDRRMLDRIGDEVARATTVVRYAPGSQFSRHIHGGGEEFLVLEGVFQDEHGDYPAGTYIRNPPLTAHTPGTAQGATILVKLWQFDPQDRTPVCVDANALSPAATTRTGVQVIPLHQDSLETVRLEIWAPEAAIELAAHGGLEVFVLDGGFQEGGERFERDSWLRLPADEDLAAVAGPTGAKVWVKSGHLRVPPVAPGA
jgi:hypothetical protein